MEKFAVGRGFIYSLGKLLLKSWYSTPHAYPPYAKEFVIKLLLLLLKEFLTIYCVFVSLKASLYGLFSTSSAHFPFPLQIPGVVVRRKPPNATIHAHTSTSRPTKGTHPSY